MAGPVLYAAMPHYGGCSFEAAAALFHASKLCRVLERGLGGSLLAMTFNALWCEALNLRAELGVTHFAMLHADVAAQTCWADVLLAEMAATGAGVVSAVLPIKDDRGLTSTAVGTRGRQWDGFRRLTMAEVQSLPETFTLADLGLSEHAHTLLVNTGCFLADLRQPWCEKVWFEVRDRISRGPDGKFRADNWPEDWHLSQQLQRLGVPVAATRKVRAVHEGRRGYGNGAAWGTWQHDEAHGDGPLVPR